MQWAQVQSLVRELDAYMLQLRVYLLQPKAEKFPDQGLNLGPLHWECGILATGPAGGVPHVLVLSEVNNQLRQLTTGSVES